MAVLQTILLVLAILVGLVLVIALFVAKDYTVIRSIVINRPLSDVFAYIRVLKNHKNFSTWEQVDPNMQSVYTGTDGEVGSMHAWKGPGNTGEGEQEIKKITEGSRIDNELRFFKPMAGVSPVYYTTEAVSNNQTKVSWVMSGHNNYPKNIILLIFNMEKMIGTQHAKSLENLKVLLEK
jgi:hypothetical protein